MRRTGKRIPWGDRRLNGLYPHHANGGVYLCSESDGLALGVVWSDGSGAWYERVGGQQSTVRVADIAGPRGWKAAGKRVDVRRESGLWYWIVA